MLEATHGDSLVVGREKDMKPNTALLSGAGPKNQFRDARRNPDFTIDQDWASYSAAEHDRWNRLFRRSLAALQSRACHEFLAMIEALSLSEGGTRSVRISW
jgi:phenylalanine-4-hydroxylase